ncbi:hypothetical protein mhp612 [Mesomycoplasma hyopneumoniae 232]|uniref:Uncharacterized protein n=1 Tax=Mesomycoplasma hyopneumoniae (strain 232) TaxID=295358 RepID=Q5ZZU5_MESH2|nr:hypothetical protein mhp612 [Mesomycoplasma hyopneumoniae 232]
MILKWSLTFSSRKILPYFSIWPTQKLTIFSIWLEPAGKTAFHFSCLLANFWLKANFAIIEAAPTCLIFVSAFFSKISGNFWKSQGSIFKNSAIFAKYSLNFFSLTNPSIKILLIFSFSRFKIKSFKTRKYKSDLIWCEFSPFSISLLYSFISRLVNLCFIFWSVFITWKRSEIFFSVKSFESTICIKSSFSISFSRKTAQHTVKFVKYSPTPTSSQPITKSSRAYNWFLDKIIFFQSKNFFFNFGHYFLLI